MSHSQQPRQAGTRNIAIGSGGIANNHAGTMFAVSGSNSVQINILANPFPTSDIRYECLQSLAFWDLEKRWHDIEVPFDRTCEWVFGNPTYQTWLRTESQRLFWIKGNPGTGKSTLLKHILGEHLKLAESNMDVITLWFFFHARGGELQKSPLGLFRALLYQLLSARPQLLESSELLEAFKKKTKKKGTMDQKAQWNAKELAKYLEALLREVPKHQSIWIFADAMDECGEQEATELMRLLEKWTSAGDRSIWACFSCRHYPILAHESVYSVCTERENRDDISLYVKTRLNNNFPSILQRDAAIADLITDGASGMFMWARLVTDRVLQHELSGRPLQFMHEDISSFSHQDLDSNEVLDTLYDEIVQKMKAKTRSLRLIEWLCFAIASLSLEELTWAMTLHSRNESAITSLGSVKSSRDYELYRSAMESELKTLSCGLAECVGGRAQFIHQSVKEYFLNKGLVTLRALCHLSPGSKELAWGQAHQNLVRACLLYLTLIRPGCESEKNIEEATEGLCFTKYSASYWFVHAAASEMRGVDQTYIKRCLGWKPQDLSFWLRCWYAEGGAYHEISATVLGDVDSVPKYRYTNLFHIAARLGLFSLFQDLRSVSQQRSHDLDSNEVDDLGHTVLSLAAYGGHKDIVREVLWDKKLRSKGSTWSPFRPPTALALAMVEGHETIVELLLGDSQIDPSEPAYASTPLEWGERRTRQGVRAILGDISTPNPLYFGQRLVQKIEDLRQSEQQSRINRSNDVGWFEERVGHRIAQFLAMEVEDDINPPFSEAHPYGVTALHIASEVGLLQMVRLLTSSPRVKINTPNHFGLAALAIATWNGNLDTVQALLERRAQTVLNVPYKVSPMSLALFETNGQREEVAKVVLEHGITWGIDEMDYAHSAVHLTAAVLLDQSDFVELLLERTPKLKGLEKLLKGRSFTREERRKVSEILDDWVGKAGVLPKVYEWATNAVSRLDDFIDERS